MSWKTNKQTNKQTNTHTKKKPTNKTTTTTTTEYIIALPSCQNWSIFENFPHAKCLPPSPTTKILMLTFKPKIHQDNFDSPLKVPHYSGAGSHLSCTQKLKIMILENTYSDPKWSKLKCINQSYIPKAGIYPPPLPNFVIWVCSNCCPFQICFRNFVTKQVNSISPALYMPEMPLYVCPSTK